MGGDYRLFGPRLLDSLLHYKVNGFSIQWYTPSFGGGLPAYPNPLQTQFSLPQLFTFFVNPWIAILASSVIYIIIGFLDHISTYCGMFWNSSLYQQSWGRISWLRAVFLLNNWSSGHADKITFPLIVVPVYALLNRKIARMACRCINFPHGSNSSIFWGRIYWCHLLFYYHCHSSCRLFPKTFPFCLAEDGSCDHLGKCSHPPAFAVPSYTQSLLSCKIFPREVHDHYFVDWYTSIGGLVFQLVGVMTTLPFLNLIGKSSLVYVVRLSQWTGSPYGFWELDSSISPALIILLIYGVWIVLSHKPHLDRSNLLKKGIAGICLIVAIVLVVQFSTARGFLFEATEEIAFAQVIANQYPFCFFFCPPTGNPGS